MSLHQYFLVLAVVQAGLLKIGFALQNLSSMWISFAGARRAEDISHWTSLSKSQGEPENNHQLRDEKWSLAKKNCHDQRKMIPTVSMFMRSNCWNRHCKEHWTLVRVAMTAFWMQKKFPQFLKISFFCLDFIQQCRHLYKSRIKWKFCYLSFSWGVYIARHLVMKNHSQRL